LQVGEEILPSEQLKQLSALPKQVAHEGEQSFQNKNNNFFTENVKFLLSVNVNN